MVINKKKILFITEYSYSYTHLTQPGGTILDLHNRDANVQPKQTVMIIKDRLIINKACLNECHTISTTRL